MLDTILNLEKVGAWAEIRRMAPTLPANMQGPELARAYLSLSKAFEETATCPADYREAVRYAEGAVDTSDPISTLHVWALGRTAALLADLGEYKQAENAALAFQKALPGCPDAQGIAPWVCYALARVRASQGRYGEAIALWTTLVSNGGQTNITSSDVALVERAQLHLVWTLAESGRVLQAFEALPTTVQHVSAGHLHAATAITFAAAGDWQAAKEYALLALQARATGEWAIYDTTQTAELYLVLKRAAHVLGNHAQAAVWFVKGVTLLAGWNQGLVDSLIPTIRPEGGVKHNADSAASRWGAAGDHRCGLRGCVG